MIKNLRSLALPLVQWSNRTNKEGSSGINHRAMTFDLGTETWLTREKAWRRNPAFRTQGLGRGGAKWITWNFSVDIFYLCRCASTAIWGSSSFEICDWEELKLCSFEMPSGDTRKDFILATTANYFVIPSTDAALEQVRESRELNAFLDDGNCPVLAARFDSHQGRKTVKLFNQVEPSDTADKVLVFFKLQPEVITPDSLHQNVFVSSMLSSPINTLYHSVQKIFAPLLLKDEKWSRNFDPKLQSLLSELEAGLGSVVRKQDRDSTRAAKVGNEESVGGILTPQDEFQYWADASVSGYDLSERERASFFQECFQRGLCTSIMSIATV